MRPHSSLLVAAVALAGVGGAAASCRGVEFGAVWLYHGAMDPALSDLLTCPRCGPTYGLVLLPDRLDGGRVVTGTLGCANCRERYGVIDGVADLRVPGPAADPEAVCEGVADSVWAVPGEEAVRLAAYLGLEDARGTILLAGPAAAFASDLMAVSGDIAVITLGPAAATPVASALRVSTVLPLRAGSLEGAALTGGYASLVTEAVRVLAPGRQLLVEPAPEALDASGLEVLARDGAGIVARRR